MLSKGKKLVRRFFQQPYVALILITTAITRTVGIDRYPYFENDEGTYLSRALAIINESEPSYYTFWYDHSPVGPIQIAGWMIATSPLNYLIENQLVIARLFMAALAIITVRLMITIMQRLEIKRPLILLAGMLFALSPLAIYFSRRVLLDDIMTVWVLLSILPLATPGITMKRALLSGLAIGVGVLTKLTATFFVPALLILLIINSTKKIRGAMLTAWFISSGSVVVMYLLFALLRGELFPGAIDPATGEAAHVSLIETNLFQLSRGGESLAPWNSGSFFRQALEGSWLVKDAILPFILIISTFALAAISLVKRQKKFLAIFLPGLMMLLFIMRGKIVLDFYILPLIPFGLMAFAALIDELTSLLPAALKSSKKMAWGLTSLLLVLIAGLQLLPSETSDLLADETSNQRKAVDWLLTNTTPEDRIILDAFAYPEFRAENGYLYADYFLKAEYDPAVQEQNYGGDWQNVDYIMLTHEIVRHLERDELEFVREALVHADLVADFTAENRTAFLDLPNNVSTNGDWAQIYDVKSRSDVVLQDSWTAYNAAFIEDYGRIIDPQENERSTSEGQAYGLLRAVQANERERFDGIWQWTKDHMQKRLDDKLLSWQWEQNPAEGDARITDSNPASDAEVDAALALIQAHKKWGEQRYLDDAQELMDNIWEHLVYELPDDRLVLLPFPDPDTRPGYIVFNPSYLAPYNFSVFAETTANDDHDWNALTSDSLSLIDDLQQTSDAGLVPDWAVYYLSSQTVDDGLVAGFTNGGEFGFDALRTPWRIAQFQQSSFADDAEKQQATKILESFADFTEETVKTNDQPFAIYDWVTGQPRVDYQSLPMSASLEIALRASERTIPDSLNQFTLSNNINPGQGYFGDAEVESNYYTQNIGALYFPLIAELTDFDTNSQ